MDIKIIIYLYNINMESTKILKTPDYTLRAIQNYQTKNCAKIADYYKNYYQLHKDEILAKKKARYVNKKKFQENIFTKIEEKN
jgi:translation initiation factor IF-3